MYGLLGLVFGRIKTVLQLLGGSPYIFNLILTLHLYKTTVLSTQNLVLGKINAYFFY